MLNPFHSYWWSTCWTQQSVSNSKNCNVGEHFWQATPHIQDIQVTWQTCSGQKQRNRDSFWNRSLKIYIFFGTVCPFEMNVKIVYIIIKFLFIVQNIPPLHFVDFCVALISIFILKKKIRIIFVFSCVALLVLRINLELQLVYLNSVGRSILSFLISLFHEEGR